jgi:transposase
MESVMDILDRHGKKDMFIVMDNCKIHHSRFVVDLCKKRGYKPLYMPPYSPFLNPIEECWAKIKANIKRNPLSKDDQLSDRISEACHTVTIEDCQGWIRHAETYWDRCLQKELGLK